MPVTLPRLILLILAPAVLSCNGNGPHPTKASDGAPPADAPPPPADADPSCARWRQAWPTITDVTLLETTAVHPERSARLRVDLEQCPGDRFGWWAAAPSLENRFLSIEVRVWRQGPDCTEPEVAHRELTVEFPYLGTWTIPTGDGGVEIDVAEPPSGTCGDDPPDACQRDCDCPEDERCLSGMGDDGPVQRCVRPCEFDRECGGGVCGDQDGFERVCDVEIAECAPPERPCPDGYLCSDGVCQPDFVLDGSTRHPCDCDADCGAPLRCADDFVTGNRRCQLLCPSPREGWCEGPHTCRPDWGVEAASGVCEWVGE